jgi:hypothetical protein
VALVRGPGPEGGIRSPERLARPHRVNDAVDITSAEVARAADGAIEVRVVWYPRRSIALDFSVAVHLLGGGGVERPVIAQADAAHPVGGWWPTSAWSVGQPVLDAYRLEPPLGSVADAVRITLYQAVPGGFANGEWLQLMVPSVP